MSSFKDHFSALAAQYAAFRPQYPPALFDYLAGLCAGRRLAWDCACGSGQATLALAERFDSVSASDASAAQIAAAAAHPRVRYRVAPAEASGLEAGSVDLVTVAQSMHWFVLDKFYAEVDRVLSSDGVLAVWTYGAIHIGGAGLNDLVQKFYSETVGPYWPPERRLVETGYRTLPFPFSEMSAPAFEMTGQWPLARLLGYLRSWSATGRYVAQHGVDPVVALGEQLENAWGDPSEARTVHWPLAMRVGRKI